MKYVFYLKTQGFILSHSIPAALQDWPFFTVYQWFVIFHNKAVANDIHLKNHGNSNRGKTCAERKIFWLITTCYYLTLLRYHSLDRPQVNDQPWIWKGNGQV
jgi:hypothetical protein